MAKQTLSYEDAVALYEKLVATNPKAERKGDTMPYTSVNGNMYSYVSKDGAVNMRLPADVRATFIEKYKTTLTVAYGIVQKEYAVVPESLLKKTAELKTYFDESYKYVSALRPKPTKSKKKE